MGANAAKASERATENTQKLCYISINSCLPVRVLTNWLGSALHVERRPTGARFACFSPNSPPVRW
jgi:hypothetical protein